MKKLQIKKNKNLDNRKFNNGITLIALVVTVIILLILAGIGIGALGSDGLIQKARDAREQAEIDNEKEIVETSVIQAVAKNRYGNIEKAGLETYLDVNTGEGNTKVSEDDDIFIVEFTQTNRYYSVDKDGNVRRYEILFPVTKPETGGSSFSRSRGTIEIQFLEGTSYNIGQANKPKIDNSNMVPVNFDGESWNVTDEENWDYSYDETNKKWANVMLKDTLELEGMGKSQIATATIAEMKGKKVTTEGSMLVWIPRYCYKIIYYNSSNEIIGYSDARGIVDKDGKTPTGYAEPVTSIAVGDNYRTHPAFEKDLEQGGWEKRLTGIWLGKFETTTKVDGKLTIRPGVTSYCQTIGIAYIEAQDLIIGNSHMVKNSEWGAMAYLTMSKYGAGSIERNGGYLTGGGTGTSYISNTSQSTTKNVYGIYDIAGCREEMVAAYIPDGTDSNANVFTSTDNTTNNKTISTKYATVYLMVENKSINSNFSANLNRKFGDAVFEISNGGINEYWNGGIFEARIPGRDYNNTSDLPYIKRGTGYSSSWNGILQYSHQNGTSTIGFRICFAI